MGKSADWAALDAQAVSFLGRLLACVFPVLAAAVVAQAEDPVLHAWLCAGYVVANLLASVVIRLLPTGWTVPAEWLKHLANMAFVLLVPSVFDPAAPIWLVSLAPLLRLLVLATSLREALLGAALHVAAAAGGVLLVQSWPQALLPFSVLLVFALLMHILSAGMKRQLSLAREREQALLKREGELLAIKEDLERSMKDRSEFFAKMSHELRTPLNSVLGYAGRLSRSGGDGLTQKQSQAVSAIERAGHHLLSLVEDVLDLADLSARRSRHDAVVLDLADVVREAVNQHLVLSEKAGLQLQMDLPQNPVLISGYRVRCLQVVNNLLSNAIRYTPRGSVTVRLRLLPGHPSPTATVAVSDTGVGIAADQQAQVFSPYHRVLHHADGLRHGAGLGLPIVRELVELHGGVIRVESEPGRGSCFTVELPALAEQGAEHGSLQPPAA